jgi:ankyrin repeat protein
MSVLVITKRSLSAINTFVSHMSTRVRNKMLKDAGIDLAQRSVLTARTSLYVGLVKRNSLVLNNTSVLVLIAHGDIEMLNTAHGRFLYHHHSPLWLWAVEQEDDAFISALIEAGVRVCFTPAFSSSAPVFHAAMNPNDLVIKAVLAAGAVVGEEDERTAIEAARNPNERVIQALIDAGVDLSLGHLNGRTTLSEAAQNHNLLVLRAVLAAGLDATNDVEAMMSATGHSDERAVGLLLAAGANANAPTSYGDRPVCRAAQNRNVLVVDALIRAGADCNARDHRGRTACHEAACNPNPRVMISLIAAGADVNALDGEEMAPVHDASRYCNVAVLRVLLAAGVDVTEDESPSAFSMCAAQPYRDGVECALLLLAAGYKMLDDDLEDLCSAQERREWESLAQDEARIAAASASIKKQRVDLIRWRALEVCVGLQSLKINALQMCKILKWSCAPFSQFVAFHTFWNIATTVLHFKERVSIDIEQHAEINNAE